MRLIKVKTLGPERGWEHRTLFLGGSRRGRGRDLGWFLVFCLNDLIDEASPPFRPVVSRMQTGESSQSGKTHGRNTLNLSNPQT